MFALYTNNEKETAAIQGTSPFRKMVGKKKPSV